MTQKHKQTQTKRRSHKEKVEASIEAALPKMADILKYTQDEYTYYKYELAFKWANFQDLGAKAIRLLVLSTTFQNWWNKKIHLVEKSFFKSLITGESLKNRRDRFETMVLLLQVWPSDKLLEEIQNEGAEILMRRKDLKKMDTTNFK